MKTRAIHIFIHFVVFVILAGGTAWGAATPSEMEQALLDRINGARQNPAATAASIGIDPVLFAGQWPELQALPEAGLPPLRWNSFLSISARRHTEDMLVQGYVDRVTPEGQTVIERTAAAGYWPVLSGESIGLVGFANFLAPEIAVPVMFENILKDEILNRAEGKWNILNPDFTEVGVAIETGVMDFGGYLFNVYMAVCDYGRPYQAAAEEELFFVLLNQARSNPVEFLRSVGLSVDRLMPDLKGNLENFSIGMTPLFPNMALFKAARAHSSDMLSRGYFSADSQDGRTPGDRMAEAGYGEALQTGETQGLLPLCGDRTPEEQVNAFFQRTAISELTRKYPEERLLFNPSIREAGVGFSAGNSESLGGICGDFVGLVVIDFGTGTAGKSGVVGAVLSDKNGDGLYDPGEGVPGMEITVTGESDVLTVTSGPGGGFHVPLGEGVYEIGIPGSDPEDRIPVDVLGSGESVFIRISPVTLPGGETMEGTTQKGLDN